MYKLWCVRRCLLAERVSNFKISIERVTQLLPPSHQWPLSGADNNTVRPFQAVFVNN